MSDLLKENFGKSLAVVWGSMYMTLPNAKRGRV
eukprot:CAMPEP_0194778504 /NCGR_PEP_ID=MMETSP0323_2-20130528/68398_1 /TAXON_ID=2866 ORGANISM="Crypthecodinium cohnii, Strain Seligo" /NCGR_SAMPLE_ID=MMETSP0323_2 /ASSEMBLY_ACC=CAM_ASM_000346 /LENGTH=32 /DNA_ID= /DNA_START= /DNA_END= /DNA_ORIENTATION=